MEHTIKLSVGRPYELIGFDVYYRTSLPAKQVRHHHATACKEIGLACWTDYFSDNFDISKEEAEVLFKIPGMTEFFEENEVERFELEGDTRWSDIYMFVAQYGATLAGNVLEFKEIEAEEIEAGGLV